MKIKALGIAPYQGLKELMNQLGKEDKELDLEVVLANLQNGVQYAKKAEQEGFDLIISRGGTATLIKEHVSIPVIDIQVSGYDMLRVLTLVKDYNGSVAILGFRNISEGAASICSLLDIQLDNYTINDESEVEEKLNHMKEKGIDVVVGDVITVEKSQQLGLQEILLTSGKESVLQSFEAAKEIYRSFKALKEQHDLLVQTLNRSKQGAIIIDEQYNLVYLNDFGKRLIEDDKAFISSRGVHTFLEQIFDVKQVDSYILRYKDTLYQASGTALDYDGQKYAVIYLDKHSTTLDKEETGVSIIDPGASFQKHAFSRITGSSELMRNTVKTARNYSQVDIPVWITGENGTGKEVFAHAIHQASSRRNQPFIQMNGGLVDEARWKEILFGANEEQGLLTMVKPGTVYIKHIEKMPLEVGRQLAWCIQSGEAEENPRFIFSSTNHLENGSFSDELYYLLTGGKLHIPPLRERKEDIEDLTRLFIASFNSQYGKQIVGLHRDLLQELKMLYWPGNIEQLRRAIEQFVIQTDSLYIQKEDVLPILTHLQDFQDSTGTDINLQGTLEEIEKQIILKVLEEENMNQSSAAKRLGINRTTLWRKLK